MKAFFLAAALVAMVLSARAQTFCITVYDVCGDNQESTGQYQLTNPVDFDYYYIKYNAVSKGNRVRIRIELDGSEQYNQVFCGCGATTWYYPTEAAHRIKVFVSCMACSEPPYTSGTAEVNVYTPVSWYCGDDCPNP